MRIEFNPLPIVDGENIIFSFGFPPLTFLEKNKQKVLISSDSRESKKIFSFLPQNNKIRANKFAPPNNKRESRIP